MSHLQGNLSMFRPDLFSQSVPTFSETSLEKCELIKKIIELFFNHLELGEFSILQCGGMEINSNNFKISSVKGQFLLKKIKINNNLQTLNVKAQINNWLNDQAILLPKIFKSHHNNLVVEFLGDAWCLFQFHEGNYFYSDINTLLKIGLEIDKMHGLLPNLPQELSLPKTIEYFNEDDWTFLINLSNGSISPADLIKDKYANDFILNFNLVKDAASEIINFRSIIEKIAVQVCHLDLHPHNILVQDKNPVAIVDFESFHQMPLDAALGFAFFKLSRQHLSSAKSTLESLSELKSVRQSFFKSLKIDSERERSLRIMAKTEVLRRIIYILQSNFYRNDTTWNHVLLIQLVGIAEIDVIFDA